MQTPLLVSFFMDIEIRSGQAESYAPREVVPDDLRTNVGQSEDALPDIEPVSDYSDGTLKALGIDEDLRNIPEEDRANVGEVGRYIAQMLKDKGVQINRRTFTKAVNTIKSDFEMDPDVDPQVFIDRVSGVAKSWRDLAFLNPQERKSILMSLARAKTSKEMNEIVFKKMNDRRIWQ